MRSPHVSFFLIPPDFVVRAELLQTGLHGVEWIAYLCLSDIHAIARGGCPDADHCGLSDRALGAIAIDNTLGVPCGKADRRRRLVLGPCQRAVCHRP